jgi:hypothetical protein
MNNNFMAGQILPLGLVRLLWLDCSSNSQRNDSNDLGLLNTCDFFFLRITIFRYLLTWVANDLSVLNPSGKYSTAKYQVTLAFSQAPTILDLADNNLSGDLPSWPAELRILDPRGNALDGTILPRLIIKCVSDA